jgi:hypothetical protein
VELPQVISGAISNNKYYLKLNVKRRIHKKYTSKALISFNVNLSIHCHNFLISFFLNLTDAFIELTQKQRIIFFNFAISVYSFFRENTIGSLLPLNSTEQPPALKLSLGYLHWDICFKTAILR